MCATQCLSKANLKQINTDQCMRARTHTNAQHTHTHSHARTHTRPSQWKQQKEKRQHMTSCTNVMEKYGSQPAP